METDASLTQAYVDFLYSSEDLLREVAEDSGYYALAASHASTAMQLRRVHNYIDTFDSSR